MPPAHWYGLSLAAMDTNHDDAGTLGKPPAAGVDASETGIPTALAAPRRTEGDVIRVMAGGPAGGPPRTYRIAGGRLQADIEVEDLSPFEVAHPRTGRLSAIEPPPATLGTSSVEQAVHRGIVVDRERDVRCTWHDGFIGIDIEDVGLYVLDTARGVIALPSTFGAPPLPIERRALLSAPLSLMLASRGTFVLHASGVRLDGHALVFLGVSGAGKSTMARMLDNRFPVFSRIADDMLPTGFHASSAVAQPGFPQLKLSAEAQRRCATKPELPIAALYLLSRAPDIEPDGVSSTRLAARDAMLALVTHTDSTRLFGRDLLAAHLAYCMRLSRAVPMYSLSYGDGEACLDAVAAVLAADFARR